MQGFKRRGAGSARNPKTVRITVSIAGHIHEQLERVADQLGQNKGATASMALSLGLRDMDPERVPAFTRHHIDEQGDYHNILVSEE